MPTAESRRARAAKEIAGAKNERSSFDAHWRELADFIKPRRSRFQTTDRNRGDRRSQKIIDSAGTFAARTLASGMMSGVTSPARPWKRLTTPDPELAEFGSVKDWLYVVNRRMDAVFLRSNLYNALPTVYSDMGIFGTAAMLVAEDDDEVVRCYPFAIGSYYLGNDSKLRVRVFAREFELSVRQIVEMFGLKENGRDIDWSKLSTAVKTAWDSSNYDQWIKVSHLISPNAEYSSERIESKYQRFGECYFEGSGGGDDKLLRESGFEDFPVLAPRWEVTGEDIYGTDCPGMTALGDIKSLQLMKKYGLQAIEKGVKPPMIAPPETRSSKLSIIAGDVSYVAEAQGKQFRPAMTPTLNLADLKGETDEARSLIRRAFYEDLFLMLSMSDRREITATEIMERREEKLLALGPVLEQLNQDLLNPLIDRTFAIMHRRGMIPDPPPELEGMELRVEYESVMAQAQKAVGLSGLERFTAFAFNAVTATTDPTKADKIDFDQVLDEHAEMSGVPPRVVRSDEDVAKMRADRAKQQQAQSIADQAPKLAGAAKALGEADVSGDNALSRLLGAGGEQSAGLAAAGAGG